MATTRIYNDFRPVDVFRTRFRRDTFEIWDANLHHGSVQPFACPEEICQDVPAYETLYSLKECECFGFEDCAFPVQGFCHDQHFYLDQGRLRQATTDELCNGLNHCLAGAPYPPQAPSVNSGCGGCDAVGVSYVITYVTDHAGVLVESAPSPPSDVVASSGDVPNASVSWAAAPAGYCVVAVRIYRTETVFEDGTTPMDVHGGEFVFVAEIPGAGGGNFNDNVSSFNTDGPLTTHEPMAFPAPPNLVGLARTTDGVVVADAHRVYISVGGQPQFTWDGVVEVPEGTIQAIAAIQNTIFVFTDNKPVKIAYRLTQNVMSIDKQVVERRLPLCSIKSLSTYDDKVYFGSKYGLYEWDIGGYGSDIGLAPRQLITPEQWKNIGCESVRGTAYEFGYIFTSDRIDYSIMMEFGEDRTDTINGTSAMPISYINADAFGLDCNGCIIYRKGSSIYRWDWRRCICENENYNIYDNVNVPWCDQCDCCPWRIVIYLDNEGKNTFSKMRVEWDERSAFSLELNFYLSAFGQKELIYGPAEIINSRGFSIPRFCSSQTFCAEISGCGILSEIRLATSNRELVSSSNRFIGNTQDGN